MIELAEPGTSHDNKAASAGLFKSIAVPSSGDIATTREGDVETGRAMGGRGRQCVTREAPEVYVSRRRVEMPAAEDAGESASRPGLVGSSPPSNIQRRVEANSVHRRSLLTLVVLALLPGLAAVGCSKPRAARPMPGSKAPKGPQGFGSMMAKEWAKDLAAASPEKRVRAAKELANMGPSAASALPALKRAAEDKNAQVSAAARAAIAEIRKQEHLGGGRITVRAEAGSGPEPADGAKAGRRRGSGCLVAGWLGFGRGQFPPDLLDDCRVDLIETLDLGGCQGQLGQPADDLGARRSANRSIVAAAVGVNRSAGRPRPLEAGTQVADHVGFVPGGRSIRTAARCESRRAPAAGLRAWRSRSPSRWRTGVPRRRPAGRPPPGHRPDRVRDHRSTRTVGRPSSVFSRSRFSSFSQGRIGSLRLAGSSGSRSSRRSSQSPSGSPASESTATSAAEPAEPAGRRHGQVALAHAGIGHHQPAPLPLGRRATPGGRGPLPGRVRDRSVAGSAGRRSRGWRRVGIAYHAAECSGLCPAGQDE